ncbi:MAG: hypothetical protein ACJ71Z_14070 [Aeromicrobium sp.]
MSPMVKRGFFEALRFGAPGGAALGFILGLSLLLDRGGGTIGAGILTCISLTLFGALVGLVVSFPALLAASAVARRLSGGRVSRARLLGCLTTLAATAAVTALVFTGAIYNASTVGIMAGIAVYGAVVAWLRVPKILGL